MDMLSGRRLVWKMKPDLSTYQSTIRYFEQRSYEPVRLVSEDGQELFYCFDYSLGMFCLKDSDGHLVANICPARDCQDWSAVGEPCDHFQKEITRINNIRPMSSPVFTELAITSKGIENLFNKLANLRGYDWKDVESHEKLIYNLGRRLYVDEELRVLCCQSSAHSLSMGIINLDAPLNGFAFSCARAGCPNPAIFEVHGDKFCVADRRETLSISLTLECKLKVYLEILKKCGVAEPEEKLLDDMENWLKVVRFLWTKGTNGFTYRTETGPLNVRISIGGNLRFKNVYTKEANDKYVCIASAKCNTDVLGDSQSAGVVNVRSCTMCNPCQQSSNFPVDSFHYGINYGCDEDVCLLEGILEEGQSKGKE